MLALSSKFTRCFSIKSSKCGLLLLFVCSFSLFILYNIEITQSESHFFGLSLRQFLSNLDTNGYIIPNYLCVSEENSTLLFVLIVTSFAGNFDMRRAIRKAYSGGELRKLGILRVFLLGTLREGQSKVEQVDIIRESDEYGDVLQGDFYESYKNLTYKHLMGLKWASACNTKYIVKMDDDIVFDLYQLMKIVGKTGEKELVGHVFSHKLVERDRYNKWYVSRSEFPLDEYPTFLSGWLYMTTPSAVRSLLLEASKSEFFWIDDVFITGILASNAGLQRENSSHLLASFAELVECCIRDSLECGFVAGPSNGFPARHNEFARLSRKCRFRHCRKLPIGKEIEDICISNWHVPVEEGTAIIKPIPV